MNGRVLALSAALLLATACSTTNAVSPTASTVTRAAPAAATMSPADMATMGHPTATPAAQSTASAATPPATTAATTAPAASAINAAATAAPAPATTSAPAATSAPVVTPAPAGPSTTVTVTLADMSIKLSAASALAGTVTFAVTNGGTTIHELVVLQTTIAQSALAPDPGNPGTVLEPGFLGKVANLAPHSTGSLTLTLGPGSYVLICNEPAHYGALGMHAAFSVR